MRKHNPINERTKRKYLQHLKYSGRKSEKSLDKAAAAVERFEVHNRYRAFNKFNIEQAIAFQRHLASSKHIKTGKPLSKATIAGILSALKAFFTWLASQQGFKSKISYSDADYFNYNAKDSAVAHARRPKRFPSVEQVVHVLKSMPDNTDVEKRDRALIALALVTAARVDALRTFRLQHIDIVEGTIFQDARDVNTKFSKTFMTTFCPVDEFPVAIIRDYVNYLRQELLFGPDEPLFPRTRIEHLPGKGFQSTGLMKQHWQGTQSIRDIFRKSFEAAGIAYYHPHTLRDTLTEYAVRNNTSLEQLIALSRSVGHANLATTLNNYGGMSDMRLRELVSSMRPKTAGQ